MVRLDWKKCFPLRGRVQIQDQPDLKLEVTFLGFTQIVGILHDQSFGLSLGNSARQLSDLKIGGHLVSHQAVVSRPEEDPGHLRITFCDYDGHAVVVMIPRAELEKLVTKSFNL